MDTRSLAFARVSVDTTDFRAIERIPFSPRQFSHKLKISALWYELAISIGSGRIVWANGAFEPGLYTHISVFRQDLKNVVEHGDCTIAGSGYTGEKCVQSGDPSVPTNIHTHVRTCHETIIEKLKIDSVIGERFRRCLEKYSLCSHTIVNLIYTRWMYLVIIMN